MKRPLTRSQRWACVAPFAVSALLFGLTVAFPGTPGDRVCANAFAVMQVGLDDQVQTASGPGISPGLAARVLRSIDFDVLVDSVPAELRDDVAVLRRGAPALLAGIEKRPGESDAAVVSPRLASAAVAVNGWINERCR